RLYDDNALQTLQQILFFKELGFSLKEIRQILENPDFDRITAFKEQKKMFRLKRNRIDRLIQLLERLEKGEDVASEPVQSIVEEIIANAQATAPKLLIGGAENYCRMMIDTYSNDYLSKVFDTKHGPGSSEYIVKAFRYYSENNCTENN
ncbi:MAG TPA: MerR family transcriptional regulator, partial [Candidatus Sellimonas avistercoris]|nr:MerR family transcriptional regulator [Candidatus Sellimonas avistercoris]